MKQGALKEYDVVRQHLEVLLLVIQVPAAVTVKVHPTRFIGKGSRNHRYNSCYHKTKAKCSGKMFKLFTCAVCQAEMKSGEGVSIHTGSSSNRRNSKPWDGPFLCINCQEKRESMKRKKAFTKVNEFGFVSYHKFMITNHV